MRKYLYFAAAAASVALTAMAALPASAATSAVLTAGGADVAVGDTVAASLASGTNATFFTSSTGSTGVTCTSSSFSSTVTSNPAAPGVATESVDGQTFSGCTANNFGVFGVNSITVDNLPYSASVDDSTNTITITGTSAAPIQATVSLNTLFGAVTCVYQANGNTLTGAVSNADNSITFSNQQFGLSSGSGLCPGSSYFSAKYSPVTDTTAGAPVTVN
jgi:hypothetical protein